MKSYIPRLLAAIAAFLLTGVSIYALLFYTQPLYNQLYDLSMFGGSEGAWGEWDGDAKGWTVFVQEGEARHELDAFGWGGYNGLDYPGQTVYFSRTMTEELGSPTLRLYVANRSVAVFLDDDLLYTDCPELDNRVGHLALSDLSWDRDPLVVGLPSDYVGKTLTIAQSSPEISDSPSVQVTLCAVELYCSYAANSALIAESFRAAIPATLSFVLGVLAMAALLWQGFHGRWDMGLAVLAVTALSLMLALLSQATFAYAYFGETSADPGALCRAAALSSLLAFLGQRGGRLRWLLWAPAVLHGCLTLLGRGDVTSIFATPSELAGVAGMLASAVLALLWRREGRRFYRLFAPLYLGFLALAAAGTVVCGLFVPEWGRDILIQLQASIDNGIYRFFLWKWVDLAFAACGITAMAEVLRQERERHMETRLLIQRGTLAQENYENLRSQNDEILSLRHDLRHHATALRGLCQEGDLARVTAYLDTLGAQDVPPGGYTVHPAVNTVLTAMLSRGTRLGIRSEVRAQLPRRLTVPDSDLCALLMNLLENALEANEKAPRDAEKWIKVILHVRGDYLYIGVENTRFEPVSFDQEEGVYRSTKGDGLHGYGLKSVRGIARKYHSKLRIEVLEGRFSASTALLLPE